MIARLTLIWLLPAAILAGYTEEQEAEYLANFDAHMAVSYAAADDSSLLGPCKQVQGIPITNVVVVSSDSFTVTSQDVQAQCDSSQICVIPSDLTLTMTESLDVGALSIEGSLLWTDETQTSLETYLCAGYVVTETGGDFYMNLASKQAWIYLKNNGATHSQLRTRVFGGIESQVEVTGRPLQRTWSLLDQPLSVGETSLRLLHHPFQMGWRIGDRIGVAPTERASQGTGQTFTITGISEDGTLSLDSPSVYDHIADFLPSELEGQGTIMMSAEVVNLSRNIVITGDDYEHIPCDPDLTSDTQGCACNSYRSTCTVGLHAIHALSGVVRVSNTRVEKCGQRGIMGKYCLHFHKLKDCPDCLFYGNAIETSHARGIIIHDTHRSLVENIVLWNVRGAGIYVEDGNEMYNSIKYNVAICPFPRHHPVQWGCTIPGTDNGQADGSLNQAGFYLKSPTNDLIGNRAANSFNGMFAEPGTDGDADTNVCSANTAIGRWEGNTFHGHARFGTYPINLWPRVTDRSLESNGFNVDKYLCEGFDSDGITRGLSQAIVNNLDYHNVFVGQYGVGDLQYKQHTSISNNNLIYWKMTKNFEDGCSAHISRSYYAFGNLALPDQATFIIEDSYLEDVHLEANHHCGILCFPQYIFHNTYWKHSRADNWMDFQTGETNFGGIFALSPDMNPEAEGSPFPPGFVSLVHSHYEYLLSAPNDECVSSIDLGLGSRYDNGILCKKPLRALKIYSHGLVNDGTAPSLRVEVEFLGNAFSTDVSQLIPFHEADQQGYSFPVIPSSDVSYTVSLTTADGNIPTDWVVEFSDPVIGNRWGVEYLLLDMRGRDCGSGVVSSHHDRRFIFASGENFLIGPGRGGHGACAAGGVRSVLALSRMHS